MYTASCLYFISHLSAQNHSLAKIGGTETAPKMVVVPYHYHAFYQQNRDPTNLSDPISISIIKIKRMR